MIGADKPGIPHRHAGAGQRVLQRRQELRPRRAVPVGFGEEGQQRAVRLGVGLQIGRHGTGKACRPECRTSQKLPPSPGRSTRSVAPSRLPCMVMATRLRAGQYPQSAE